MTPFLPSTLRNTSLKGVLGTTRPTDRLSRSMGRIYRRSQ